MCKNSVEENAKILLWNRYPTKNWENCHQRTRAKYKIKAIDSMRKNIKIEKIKYSLKEIRKIKIRNHKKYCCGKKMVLSGYDNFDNIYLYCRTCMNVLKLK